MHSTSIVKLFAALVAASSPALAELAMTFPVAGSSCTGGQTCQIAWKDNGVGVSLAQQGNCTIALYTGGAQQQTFLQPIVFPTTVNVATTAAVEFTVDPTVGPNSDQYFIRISSSTLTQNTTSGTATANPYLSFSAKFSLTGMTGTFNETVQAQISSAASSQVQTATSSRSTVASSTRSTTSASHSSTSSTGAGFRDGANGALFAGAAFVAGAVALF